jgi:transposase-like protein
MEDYPRTLSEVEVRFSTEADCRAYLAALRWPDGFRCPSCQAGRAWQRTNRPVYVCAACGKEVSLTAGTIFQDSRMPLTLWFRAVWQLVSQKNGVSAMSLQRNLGFGSYETAWTWLHKLRRAMVRPGRERLSGRIEVDETYVGGEEEGVRGRETEGKSLVAIAAQEDGNGIGRIRLRRIPDASAESLHAFVTASIEPGSCVRTDGWGGYAGLQRLGYKHEVTVLAHRGKNAAIRLLPRVHRVAALLKRWLMGTHQGAVASGHLDYYLDEYTFRFNRRTSASRGKLFYRLLQQAVQVAPAPYDRLVRPQHNP